MESYLTEEVSWANTLAARLRLLHAEFSDGDPKQRDVSIGGELDRALVQVAPNRRAAYLQQLEQFFPIWGGSLVPVSSPGPVAPSVDELVAPMANELPAPTADELATQLLTQAATMNESERTALARRLLDGGLAVREFPPQPSVKLPPPAMTRSPSPSLDAPVDSDRAQQLVVSLAGVFQALDQLVWTLWRQLNAKSAYRREVDFGKLVGPYLATGAEISSEQLRPSLERTRRLIATLLGAIGRSGAKFAQKHSTDMSPEWIMNAARIEKGTFESLEAASWRKYLELYKEYCTEQTIERQVQQEFVDAAEELLLCTPK